MRLWTLGSLALAALASTTLAAAPPSSGSQEEAFALLKARCVRCHGPARQEGGLSLAVPAAIVRGGRSGPAVTRAAAVKSLLWRRVAADQMPQGEPLSALEKSTLRRWLQAGAPGLPGRVPARPDGDEHWSSQKLRPVTPPAVKDASRVRTPIDRFVQARLETQGRTLGPDAPPEVLIRRVTFDLTGLPPTPDEVEAFVRECAAEFAAGRALSKSSGRVGERESRGLVSPAHPLTRSPIPPRQPAAPSAYERLIDRLLASPRFGERWGKYWLDAAGYADSNGYFSADTDRPLAYRYRDYVVRSLNADKPWDRFIQEQLAGDELVGYQPGSRVEPAMAEALEATHFLRNSQDGTDSSDGNPDERRADKYAVIEGTQQIIGASLLGITVQCARCHDHKFEPFTQKDYYGLQAVLYPAFNVEKWVMPAQREMDAATPAELATWEASRKAIEEQVAAKRREWAEWVRENRETGRVLFQATFDGPGERASDAWSNTVPGDAAPAGKPAINLDSATAPAARIANGRLYLHESGSAGDRALSTRQTFDWAPKEKGMWIQATFDLVADGSPAPYVGYFLALRDFVGASGGGNILLDGAAAGKAAVHVGYPAKSVVRGSLGESGYAPGRNYGVRVTNAGDGKFELEQVVDGVPEPGRVQLTEKDLPSGAFGFEFCCGRSFVVDNVLIEAGGAGDNDPARAGRRDAYRKKRAEFEAAVKALEARKPARPGKLAGVTDLSPEPPKVPLLIRGEYKSPGEAVDATAPSALSEPANPATLTGRAPEVKGTTGRRLAFARWLTQPGSRASARLARVTVNRFWQHLFGTGLVATPENLGYSGASPSDPLLLEWLAGAFVSTSTSQREGMGVWGYGGMGRASGSGPRSAENVIPNQGEPSITKAASRARTHTPTLPYPLTSPKEVPANGSEGAAGYAMGWSAKKLIRAIVLSGAYRQSSEAWGSDLRKSKIENRDSLRRLDAEAIRDAMLAVSGELDPAMGGPYVPTTRNGEGEVVVAENAAGAHRRSLYLQQRRTQVTGMLDVFDAPSVVFNCTYRTPTTVPLQSLTLLNSSFVRARAGALAKRLRQEAGDDPRARIRRAYLLVMSRLPAAQEVAEAEAFLTAQAAEYGGGAKAEEPAWTDFCQSLLASNAFLYLM